jgi:hypothetical protein
MRIKKFWFAIPTPTDGWCGKISETARYILTDIRVLAALTQTQLSSRSPTEPQRRSKSATQFPARRNILYIERILQG